MRFGRVKSLSEASEVSKNVLIGTPSGPRPGRSLLLRCPSVRSARPGNSVTSVLAIAAYNRAQED